VCSEAWGWCDSPVFVPATGNANIYLPTTMGPNKICITPPPLNTRILGATRNILATPGESAPAMSLFKKFFDDKRYTVGILVAWMMAVCTIFYFLGAFHMSYMHVGPGKDTVFMGLRIDNWAKWSALAVFSFMNTCINEFISNALNPWFLNSLQVRPH